MPTYVLHRWTDPVRNLRSTRSSSTILARNIELGSLQSVPSTNQYIVSWPFEQNHIVGTCSLAFVSATPAITFDNGTHTGLHPAACKTSLNPHGFPACDQSTALKLSLAETANAVDSVPSILHASCMRDGLHSKWDYSKAA